MNETVLPRQETERKEKIMKKEHETRSAKDQTTEWSRSFSGGRVEDCQAVEPFIASSGTLVGITGMS